MRRHFRFAKWNIAQVAGPCLALLICGFGGRMKRFDNRWGSTQHRNMAKFLVHSFIVATIAVVGFSARAEILFEGYYRIESKNEPVGYVIQQMSQDDAKKTQTIRYYILRKNGDEIERSGVEAVRALDGTPKSATSWMRMDDTSMQARAHFHPGRVNVQYLAADLKKVLRDENLEAPRGAGISSFVLQALAAKNPDWTGSQKYESFVEENMRFASGEVFLRAQPSYAGVKLRQIEDQLLSERIELISFRDGNLLGSRSEDGTQLVYLVADQKTATAEMPFLKNEVMDHFGDRIPDGRTHPLVDGDVDGVRDFLRTLPTGIPRQPGSVGGRGGSR